MRAVQLSLSLMLSAALCFIRSLTVSTSPVSEALINGVLDSSYGSGLSISFLSTSFNTVFSFSDTSNMTSCSFFFSACLISRSFNFASASSCTRFISPALNLFSSSCRCNIVALSFSNALTLSLYFASNRCVSSFCFAWLISDWFCMREICSFISSRKSCSIRE